MHVKVLFIFKVNPPPQDPSPGVSKLPPRARFGPLPVWVNKVLLERHTLTHRLTICLLSPHNSRARMHTEPDAHRPGRLAFGEQFADHRSCPQSGILVSGTKVPPFMLCPQVLRSLLLSSHVLFTPLFGSHPKDAPQTPPV